MDFYPSAPLDTNIGQNKVWAIVREAFANEDGLAFYRFPIYLHGGYLHREIDVLLLFGDYGVFIIKCKGYRVENIQSTRGHVWGLRGWYKQQDTPFEQVSRQMYAIRGWLGPLGDLAQKVRFFHRVALPLIYREECEQSGLNTLPSTQAISTNDELTVDGLRHWVFGAPLRQALSPET